MKDFQYYATIKSPYFYRSDFTLTTWVSGGKIFATKLGHGQLTVYIQYFHIVFLKKIPTDANATTFAKAGIIKTFLRFLVL